MRIKIIFVIVLYCLSMTVFAQQKKVAVYVTGEDAGVNKVLGSKLVTAIARSEQYTAIERTDAFLAELSKELKYQQTGAVNEDELSRLGKQFGVQYVCVASVFPAFNEQYISVRLIDVETAQVECSASTSDSIKTLDALISAADRLARSLLTDYSFFKRKDLKKVAVYVVKNDSEKDIERVLGDQLVLGFTKSHRYTAIERSDGFLTQLSKEQKYQGTGAVDNQDLSRLGRQFGVQYVCVADVTDVLGEKFISTRLIDVETAETLNSFETGGQLRTMSECLGMTKAIASNLSKGTFKEQAEDLRINEQIESTIREQIVSMSKESFVEFIEEVNTENTPLHFTEEFVEFVEEVNTEDPPLHFTEEMPEFPGGDESLIAFLVREIKYPKKALKKGIKGTVLIEFVVEKDGSVSNAKVKIPLSPECDKEAMRGVMAMPKWKPGKNMGKPVRCFFQVPITFK